MPTLKKFPFVFLLVAAAAGVTPVHAQAPAPVTSFLAGAGPLNFDLSGTGTTAAYTVRVSRELGSQFVVEASLLLARPVQQFVGVSTLLAPEVQLQYHWAVDRFTPYVGAGIGGARVSSDLVGTDWDPTISFGGGTRFRVNDRFGVFGEFRLRGIDWDFAGSTTDVIAGVVARVGR